MSVYEHLKRNRRIVAGTAGLLIALVVAVMTIGVISDDGPGLLRAIATVAALTMPAWFALISLDRRPSLLPGAMMAALILGVVTLELLPLYLVVAIVWGLVARNRLRPAPEPAWARFGRPLLAATVVVPMLLMFAHLDPVCTVTDADGRVEQVDPAAHGLESGWHLGAIGYIGSSSNGSASSGTCTPDTVVWWEAVMSIAATAGIVSLALRWPTGESLVANHQRPAVPA